MLNNDEELINNPAKFLEELPIELLWKIIHELDSLDFLSLIQTNKQIYAVCQSYYYNLALSVNSSTDYDFRVEHLYEIFSVKHMNLQINHKYDQKRKIRYKPKTHIPITVSTEGKIERLTAYNFQKKICAILFDKGPILSEIYYRQSILLQRYFGKHIMELSSLLDELKSKYAVATYGNSPLQSLIKLNFSLFSKKKKQIERPLCKSIRLFMLSDLTHTVFVWSVPLLWLYVAFALFIMIIYAMLGKSELEFPFNNVYYCTSPVIALAVCMMLTVMICVSDDINKCYPNGTYTESYAESSLSFLDPEDQKLLETASKLPEFNQQVNKYRICIINHLLLAIKRTLSEILSNDEHLSRINIQDTFALLEGFQQMMQGKRDSLQAKNTIHHLWSSPLFPLEKVFSRPKYIDIARRLRQKLRHQRKLRFPPHGQF